MQRNKRVDKMNIDEKILNEIVKNIDALANPKIIDSWSKLAIVCGFEIGAFLGILYHLGWFI